MTPRLPCASFGCSLLLFLACGASTVGGFSVVGLQDDEQAARDEEPSSSLAMDFTFVAPGAFDRPIDLMGTPEGQHGRGLGECVRLRAPSKPNLRQQGPASMPP